MSLLLLHGNVHGWDVYQNLSGISRNANKLALVTLLLSFRWTQIQTVLLFTPPGISVRSIFFGVIIFAANLLEKWEIK